MHLQEKPSRVPFLRGEPPVPDVGDKQSHVTCFGNQGLDFDAIPTQLIVIVPILWWVRSGLVTAGDHPGGTRFAGTVG